MSRYIDADKLIADLDKGLWGKDYDKALAEAIIQDAPTIEIIRCRECKYAEYRANFDDYECHYSGCGLVYNADDFCSYGEREGE